MDLNTVTFVKQCFLLAIVSSHSMVRTVKYSLMRSTVYICNSTDKSKMLYVIYTNHGGGLYQIYKLEAKPSVYRSDMNRILRFVYCF